MILKKFIEPPIDNNNYLVINEDSKEAVLIDCSSIEVNDEVKDALKEYNAKLKYILLTHGHFDHIAGIRPPVIENEEVPVLMHANDTDWVNNVNIFMQMMGLSEITVPKISKYISDNEIIKLGNLDIKVIHTPGHTKGGVCYLIEDKLFTGDTLFRESVGRCDLEGGDFNEILASIKNKLYTLPGQTEVYPGHGKSTTIEWEIEHNSYI